MKNSITEIPRNKSKIVLFFVTMLVFIALGLWFIVAPFDMPKYHPIFILILGILTALLCSIIAVFLLLKLIDKKPGLMLQEDGFTDNNGLASAGKVLWSDIIGIGELQVNRQKLILIQVKNPEDYIQRSKNSIHKFLLQANMRSYGSPIFLSNMGLKISFEELMSLLIQKVEQRN